jgi:mannose-6-phosphate isomerase-like protein (cupin superfamily)
MRIERADPSKAKGWYCGPWDSNLTISIGYANRGVDEPHVHSQVNEVYLVARGEAEVRIGQETVQITAGEILIVEPGEAHTFINNSQDYFHFVLHSPGITDEAAQAEKQPVPRDELGL